MDPHELVSLGTLAAALLGVGVQFVSRWWERSDRAAAERRHREALQMQRDAHERDLLIATHGALEKLRLRATEVLRASPAPQAWESELASAIRAARFQIGQLAARDVREAAMGAVVKGERVRDRRTFDETVDTHKQAHEAAEGGRRLEHEVENAVDKAIEIIERRLRDLDPSPAREDSAV
jgi:hypothetical protein